MYSFIKPHHTNIKNISIPMGIHAPVLLVLQALMVKQVRNLIFYAMFSIHTLY